MTLEPRITGWIWNNDAQSKTHQWGSSETSDYLTRKKKWTLEDCLAEEEPDFEHNGEIKRNLENWIGSELIGINSGKLFESWILKGLFSIGANQICREQS